MTPKTRIDPNDLLRERGLLSIWLKANPFPLSWTTWAVSLGCGLLVAAGTKQAKYVDIVLHARSLAEMGFNFATSILGFLLAGFTVFATLSRPEMFHDMAEMKKPGSELSWLKYNFFVFMAVFFEYLVFAFCCFLVKSFCFPGGPASQLADSMGLSHDRRHDISVLGAGLLSGAFVFVLMELASFVFNVYHVVMTSLAWSLSDKYYREDNPSKNTSESDSAQ